VVGPGAAFGLLLVLGACLGYLALFLVGSFIEEELGSGVLLLLLLSALYAFLALEAYGVILRQPVDTLLSLTLEGRWSLLGLFLFQLQELAVLR
jgi:hypothetical protein